MSSNDPTLVKLDIVNRKTNVFESDVIPYQVTIRLEHDFH